MGGGCNGAEAEQRAEHGAGGGLQRGRGPSVELGLRAEHGAGGLQWGWSWAWG